MVRRLSLHLFPASPLCLFVLKVGVVNATSEACVCTH
jgi:hypothetical protein